jgi:hypothetical protein
MGKNGNGNGNGNEIYAASIWKLKDPYRCRIEYRVSGERGSEVRSEMRESLKQRQTGPQQACVVWGLKFAHPKYLNIQIPSSAYSFVFRFSVLLHLKSSLSVECSAEC